MNPDHSRRASFGSHFRLWPAVAGLALLLALSSAARAEPALANVHARKSASLNGKWNTIIDPYDVGYVDYRGVSQDALARPTRGFALDRRQQDKSELIEYNFDTSPTLTVPGDWNSQNDRLLYYEGTIWYRRRFDAPKSAPGNRLFVHFGAANYEADVYLNGWRLGRHVGGFTPFAYEITGLAKEKDNSLVVRVNNRRRPDGVPAMNTDWWNYGGLTRDVLLVQTPGTFIAQYHVGLKAGTRDRIEVTVQLDGSHKQQKVTVALAGLGLKAEARTDASGVAHIEFPAAKIPLWSPERPALHDVVLSSETDQIADRIGFRTIKTAGTDILLNDKPVFLRGICIHEENPIRGGRAYSVEDARMLLGWAKELNANFVRLAHYPHNEHMARVADELGLMVWEEIPVYWAIQWENADTLHLAQSQLAELIARDQNRASVVVWSVANETPITAERTRFLKTLVDTARSLDGSRLISAAMEVHGDKHNPDLRIVDDPFGEFTDLVSFNQYIGWYDGLPDKTARISWSITYKKPVVISEFGADALQGWHADPLTRFSEEYQEDLYRKTIAMLRKIPAWRGVTPWILADFRSPRRVLPNVQDGWNRKGLIGQNGKKKKAFAVLKAFYDELEQRAARGP
jgi:beta-glucuronidase